MKRQNTSMLPDFPGFKAELDKFITARLHNKVRSRDSVVSEIRATTQHEGTNQRCKQLGPGADVVEEGFQLMSTEFTTSIEEIPTLVGDKLEKKLDEIADKAGAQLAKSFFAKVAESCDKAGMSFHANGQPISAELLLKMMSSVHVEFDYATGKPTTTLVFHPSMTPSFLKVAEQIENDPELKRRSDEILERQREAWTARESNRKLVD